jgi:hypothetical protein
MYLPALRCPLLRARAPARMAGQGKVFLKGSPKVGLTMAELKYGVQKLTGPNAVGWGRDSGLGFRTVGIVAHDMHAMVLA